MQTNNLSTALIAFLMLPYLSAAQLEPPFPRISFVASDMHYWAELTAEELRAENILRKLNDKDYCSTKYAFSSTICAANFIDPPLPLLFWCTG